MLDGISLQPAPRPNSWPTLTFFLHHSLPFLINLSCASPEAPTFIREFRMLSRYFQRLLAALALMSAYPASAFVSPPVLVPSSPLAGEVLSIDVTAGICDVFLGSITPIPVTQDGTNLRVVLPSRHEGSGTFCNFGTSTGRYVISSFPAGIYTLQIDRNYLTVFGPVVKPLATTQLVVRGVMHETPIPATSPLALLILVAGLAFIAARKRFLVVGGPSFRAQWRSQ